MRYILILSLMISQVVLPTKATSSTTYLLYGDMPSIILLQIDAKRQIRVTTLPSTLILETSCTKQSASLTTLLNIETQECLIDTLESSFPIDINHSIYLHTTTIDQDFPQHLKGSDLNNMDCITSYFSTLSSKADISLLWTYQTYITTDLTLWDLKDLFPVFTDDQLDIQYHYPHLIGNNKHWYIVDKQFYYNK